MTNNILTSLQHVEKIINDYKVKYLLGYRDTVREEVTEGEMTISIDYEGDITIALDYDEDHAEGTGEIGISCTWPTFEEAEETFLDIYKDHWEGMIEEELAQQEKGTL